MLHVKLHEEPNHGRPHPMTIGKLLFARNISGLKRFDFVGKSLVILTFDTGLTANEFLRHPLLAEQRWQAYIPSFALHTLGVIKHVSIDVTPEDIIRDIRCSAQVLHVRRLHRNLADGTKQPTETVVVTFNQQVLPPDCFLYFLHRII